MRQQGTSIIPPKEKLIREYRYHVRGYDHFESKFHLDDWASAEDCAACDWHEKEMNKLALVLEALYPGWDT